MLGCCIRRAEAQTFDGERYLVQSNASLPTRGVAKEDGIAPLQSPCVDGQSVHGSEIPTTNDWISLFLHLACMCMRAYTPTAKAATHLLIWNRHGPKWYFALLTRHGEDQFANATIIGSRRRGPVIWELERSCFHQPRNPLAMTRALSSALLGKRGIDETTEMWNLAYTGIGR